MFRKVRTSRTEARDAFLFDADGRYQSAAWSAHVPTGTGLLGRYCSRKGE